MERPADDLTARARIRDAAIRLFGERGIEGASIRDIAAEAGVSSGLVRHHFGSKESLREACDRYAKERMLQIGAELTQDHDLSGLDPLALHPVAFPLQLYIVRSMMDGSETATALFLEGVDAVEEWTTSYGINPKDRRGYAAALAAIKLSVFVFRDQVSKALGEDITTAAGYNRIGQALMEVFTIPLLTQEQVDNMRNQEK
ncbi:MULTISPECIES: TetR/AcrR family transcriptional regulator [Kribbella]|jgi:AcrR family transcriptional regulator|uniref:TetR family transcriptional regulator n=1 Tax=Kribbella pratensis TaxID=2512112 RepID=A0ABY2FQX2_9ACTN|nr:MULTISPECIES: helix-turn-helix domain-containing protein [Kribbella]TDW95533.1 TetR family transcriptional regulator [Kribbella pratensis]TDX08543.1 TetR family transcriptional regulator [Kribbella sp. VKM Ac-2566]